jgi:hypothetical protein
MEQALAEFRSGDPAARRIVIDAGRHLGAALGALVGALHVRRIVLAGTMTAFGDEWLKAVSTAAAGHALAALSDDTTFEIGRMDDIVVLGASALLMTRELGMTLRPLHPERRPRLPDATNDKAPAQSSAFPGRTPVGVVPEKGGVPG